MSKLAFVGLAAVMASIGCRGIETPRLEPPPPFLVSTPRPNSAQAALTGDVVWVALPAGTIPNADVVTIRVESTGQVVTAKAIDGGLDPVAVFAAMGDQLQLTVTKVGSSDVTSYNMAVTGSKGPVVIRTSPSKGKRDVPLNAAIVVVFSEPVAPASVTPGSVSITSAGTPVAGQLSFADSTDLVALFLPDAPLIVATDYTLAVTQAVRNIGGQALLEPVMVPFTTTDSSSTPPSPFLVSTPRPNAWTTSTDRYTDVVWVALPAGTIANAGYVNVVAEPAGGGPLFAATGKVSDGGLDPLPVAAELGDRLQVTLWGSSIGSVVASYAMTVTGSKGPVVIRTSPSKLERDVPVNAAILTVLSEPLSPASLAAGTVSLTTAGTPVAGQLRFGDSAHVTVLFTPDAPLAPATTYSLTITQGITNLDGQTLRQPAVIDFTTADSQSAPSSGTATFHVSGTVTDDAGVPLSGTFVNFWINPLPGQRMPGQVNATTDANGKFTADVISIVGSASGPPGTGDAIAFAYAYKADYVVDSRYVPASGISDLHFTLYRAPQIVPGDSALVTITANDAVCVNNTQDMHPWNPDFRCRTIYLSPVVDGSVRITVPQTCQTACQWIGLHAEPLDAVVNGTRILGDSLYINRFGNWLFDSISGTATGTLTVPVVHGIMVRVDIEMPWQDTQPETFWLHTSFTTSP